ncbi:DUF1203 domain-containing protein [Alsobacter sp. R-9]
MDFRITGLSPEPFLPLYGLPGEDLSRLGILRVPVEAGVGFPDRVEMREGRPGETMLLLNHECQPAASPYRARHAIYVREGATQTYDRVNEVPEVMRPRILSLRAYDAAGMIVDADLVDGEKIEGLIHRLLAQPAVAYVHAHNARRGCYSGRIERA